jgi:hypothetical protein
MVSQNFTRSEYHHFVYSKILNGIFIILVLYVMFVASTSMVENSRLAQLAKTFDMKDLGVTKTNLGDGNAKRQKRW